jgi:spermidine/putrescine transport system permease protein
MIRLLKEKTWDQRSRLWYSLCSLPGILWLYLFLLCPLGLLLLLSLGWDFGKAWDPAQLHAQLWIKVWTQPYRGIIFQTFLISALATGLCLVLAFPLCLFLWRLGPPYSTRGLALVLAPFLINFLVRIYAWFALLRPEGLVGSWLARLGYERTLLSSLEGILLGLVYGYLPFMILPMWASFARLDWRLWEAAEDLGASSWAILRRIVWPQCRPGILAGCLLVFIPMLGEYTIPKMLGGGLIPMLGTTIESQFFAGVRPHWSFGAALALWLSVMVTVLLVCFRKTLQGSWAGGSR